MKWVKLHHFRWLMIASMFMGWECAGCGKVVWFPPTVFRKTYNLEVSNG